MKHWRLYLVGVGIALLVRFAFAAAAFRRDVDETRALLEVAEQGLGLQIRSESILPDQVLRSWIGRRWPDEIERYFNRVTWIEFDVSSLRYESDADAACKAILQRLPRHRWLRSLTITGDGISDDQFAVMGGIRSLRELELTGTTLTSKSLPLVARHRGLEALKFHFYRENGGEPEACDFASLAPLTSLRELSLGGDGFGWDRRVRALDALPRLQALELEGGKVLGNIGDAFAALAECRTLHRLSLSGTSGRVGRSLTRLAPLPKLGGLDLSECDLSDRPLPADFGLRGLTHLSLAGTVSDDAVLNAFARHGRLESLDASRIRITDHGVAGLARCPNLSRLLISDTAVTNVGLESLGAKSRLKWLDIAGTKVDDEGLRVICRSFPLVSLKAAGTKIGDGSLADLARLPDLWQLDLTATGVTDAGLKTLPGFAKLHRLSLGNNAITDAGLPSLHRFVGIGSLDLAGTDTTRDGLAALTAATTPAPSGKRTRGTEPWTWHIHPGVKTLKDRAVRDVEPRLDRGDRPRAQWND